MEFWEAWEFKSIQIIKGQSPVSFENIDWQSKLEKDTVNLKFQVKKELKISRIEIGLSPKTSLGKAVLNGFQSWSECQLVDERVSQKNLRAIAKPLMAKSGDYTFYPYKLKKDFFHSWHYIHFLNENDKITFLGSLSPEKGYTAFEWNKETQTLIINHFCEKKLSKNETLSFSLFCDTDKEAVVISEYFNLFPAKNDFKSIKKFTGWTSWYLHYTNIDEDIISRNLNNFINTNTPIDYFQIDDGWQVSIGDWVCNEKFPNGFKAIVDRAKKHNIKPGLWLAPFIAEKDSFIFREKKDWLLKNKLGKPIKMTYNPLWSGWFYALDFYNEEAREHIAQSLKRVTKEWGFSMLKLDFLYAVGIVPQHNKSRGQVMWEAMCWLREQLKDVEILGCGVPLNVAFGNSDFCRIGPDVSESWDVNWLKIVNHAERLSTKNAIRNSILRFPIDHKAFRNDPDVFILRDKNQHLSKDQQYTLYIINQLFGNLIFTSDDISTYSPSAQNLYQQQFPAKNIQITKADFYDQLLIVHAETQFSKLKIFTNMSAYKQSVDTFENEWLIDENKALIFPEFFTLEAYETKVFTDIDNSKETQLAHSNIHLFTGNGIDSFSEKEGNIHITKNPIASNGTITLISKQSTFKVNGRTIKGSLIFDRERYLFVVNLGNI